MSDTLTFGGWLKQRRRSLDLTQGDLARRANCSVESIRKIEAGVLKPSRQLAALLAANLDVSVEQQAEVVEYARGLRDQAHAARVETQPHNLASGNSSLPQAPLTSFIGREKEVAVARRLLLKSDVRLLNMTGPGGTGKTRLAQQVATQLIDAFADGIFFVGLATITDPNIVVPIIAQTLGLRESGKEPISQTLKDHLRGKQLLLILDNFEQVAEAAALVVDLVTQNPALKVLVTSRTLLHAYGEHDFPVPPLDMPDSNNLPPLERFTECEAVRLFIERAQAVRPDFAVTLENAGYIAQICARLDGLPLAIELAAARTRILPPQALLNRLNSWPSAEMGRLGLLTGGARDMPPRQQTLRNAIGWSYDLLNPTEQTLFARLSVFARGCTLEAANAITADPDQPSLPILDTLESLLDKSLLQQEAVDKEEPRFWMLETIREYALERLQESGEADIVRHRHAAYFRDLAERAEPELQGPDQGAWLTLLEREHDNLRAAMLYAAEQGDIETTARTAASLRRFWNIHAHISEGRTWLERVLPEGSGLLPSIRARVLHAAGVLAWSQGDYAASRRYSEESLDISRTLGNKVGEASMLHNLAVVALAEGDYDVAQALHTQVLEMFRALGERWSVALTQANLGLVSLNKGDYVQAERHLKDSLALRRELGDTQGIAQSLNNLGTVMRCQGRYDEACALHEESLKLFRELGDKWSVALCLANLGLALLEGNSWDDACETLRESLVMFRELGVKQGIATCFNGIAGVAALQDDVEGAVRLFGAAEAIHSAIGVPLPPAEKVGRDRNLARARAALSEVEFSDNLEAGRLMPLDQAIAQALGE